MRRVCTPPHLRMNLTHERDEWRFQGDATDLREARKQWDANYDDHWNNLPDPRGEVEEDEARLVAAGDFGDDG